MKIKRELKLAAIFLLSFMLLVGLAGLGNSKSSYGSKVNAKVLDEVNREGSARVIVVMKEASTENQKKSIRVSAMNKIGKEKARNEYSSFNGFSATLSQSDVQKLENDDNVQAIVYDEPVSISLDQSVPLINATMVWPLQLNGTNLTGAGQTVCIVDTGIYYQHADLGGCNITQYPQSTNNESYILQSSHPYADNMNYTWNITRPGYSRIALHFKNISLEYPGKDNFDTPDRIIIYDSQLREIARYQGNNYTGNTSRSIVLNDIWTPFSEGNTIYVRLVSDVSVTDYGFYVDAVMNGSTNTTYDWSNCSKVIAGWDFVNNDGDPADDNGHGTHCAGIVAANGGKKGVAPEAKLVAAKVFDSTGTNGYMSNIISAIEYCTNRSRDLNISVISMSLGGDTKYTNYCDSTDPYAIEKYATDAINRAYARNISVIVSAGNNAWSDGITFPACVQNAIPVGATTKADALDTSYSNRNWMVQLVAPGTSITSTWNNGGYQSDTGTSMAAPHVSGAFAIMNEYLALTGRTKTPAQIESLFNSTGKLIYDSASARNYTRINVYNAITSFKPDLTILSPQNRSYTTGAIYVNLSTSGASSTWWGNSTVNYSYSSPALVNFSEGSNTVYAWANDTIGNLNSSSATFFVDSIFPNITFVPPTDNSSSAFGLRNNIAVNATASDAGSGLANLTIRLYNSGVLANITITTNGNLFINFTNLSDGFYSFNASACDYSGNCNSTETRNVSIAINPPSISIASPGNNTWQAGLRLNITANQAVQACWLSVNNGNNISMTSSSSTTFYYIDTGIAESVGKTQNITAYCNNSGGALGGTSILLGFDRSGPTISLGSTPVDGQAYTGSPSTTLSFKFTPSDLNNLASCVLIISGTQYSASTSKSEQTSSKTLSAGSYTWNVNCTDEAGNVGTSIQRSFSVTSTTSGADTQDSSSAGGETMSITTLKSNESTSENGSTSSGTTELPGVMSVGSSQQIFLPIGSGASAEAKVGANLPFILQTLLLGNESHLLIINSILGDSANITIESSPVNFVLKVGQSKMLNLTSPKYYNLYIRLNAVSTLDGRANITLIAINQPISGGLLGMIPGYSFALGLLTIAKNLSVWIFGGVLDFVAGYYIWIIVGAGIFLLIILNGWLEYRILTRHHHKIKAPEFSRYEDYHLPEKHRKKHH